MVLDWPMEVCSTSPASQVSPPREALSSGLESWPFAVLSSNPTG